MNNVDTDVLDADFVAVKVGDVNGSAQTNSFVSSEDRSVGSVSFNAEGREIEAGKTFTFDLNAMDLLAGFQFTLNFSKAVEFLAVNDAKLGTSNIGLTKLEEGAITVSWNDFVDVDFSSEGSLISLSFKANESINTDEVFSISSSYTKAEAYNTNAELFDVILNFTSADNSVVLFQNEPNPFLGITTVNFSLDKAEQVSLNFVNMAGQDVKVFDIDAEAGLNTLAISSEELGESGVYYYTLRTGDVTLTKKMVIIK